MFDRDGASECGCGALTIVLGLLILLLTAIGTGIAAFSILGHPGWLWQILATIAVLNAVAAITVAWRRVWGRRVALSLLGVQIAGAVIALVVVATAEIRDLPYLGDAISLIVFIFVPVVVMIVAISLLAAWSSTSWSGRDIIAFVSQRPSVLASGHNLPFVRCLRWIAPVTGHFGAKPARIGLLDMARWVSLRAVRRRDERVDAPDRRLRCQASQDLVLVG